MEQVLHSIQVIKEMHIVSCKFYLFFKGGLSTIGHNFQNLSARILANILNFPKHPKLLHFGWVMW